MMDRLGCSLHNSWIYVIGIIVHCLGKGKAELIVRSSPDLTAPNRQNHRFDLLISLIFCPPLDPGRMNLLGSGLVFLTREFGTIVLASKVACLSGSSITANKSRVAIEVLGDLLERCVLRFNKELPHDDQLEGDPAHVDNIVLPTDGAECDGVDVLIEPQRHVDEEEHHGQTLRIVY